MRIWLLTLVPLVIFLAYSIKAGMAKIISLAPELSPYRFGFGSIILFVGVLILLFNMRYGMIPEHRVNTVFQNSLDTWVHNSMPDDVLITAGDLDSHLAYWGNRPNTVRLFTSLRVSQKSSDKFQDLRRTMNQALCNKKAVLLAPAASEYIGDDLLSIVKVSRNDLRKIFRTYKWAEAFTYTNMIDGKKTTVYRLICLGNCGCPDPVPVEGRSTQGYFFARDIEQGLPQLFLNKRA